MLFFSAHVEKDKASCVAWTGIKLGSHLTCKKKNFFPYVHIFIGSNSHGMVFCLIQLTDLDDVLLDFLIGIVFGSKWMETAQPQKQSSQLELIKIINKLFRNELARELEKCAQSLSNTVQRQWSMVKTTNMQKIIRPCKQNKEEQKAPFISDNIFLTDKQKTMTPIPQMSLAAVTFDLSQ